MFQTVVFFLQQNCHENDIYTGATKGTLHVKICLWLSRYGISIPISMGLSKFKILLIMTNHCDKDTLKSDRGKQDQDRA